MKNILKHLSPLFIMSMLLASCAKDINEAPTHTLNGEERFQTIEDYEFALTGAYAQLLQNSYYGSSSGANAFVMLPDIMSDNLFETGESLANYTTLANWNYTADDFFIEDIWLDAYRVVQQANLTLRGIDNLTTEDAGAVNRVKSQALALRAHAHFDLLRYFGEAYDRNSAKLGVPYVEMYDVEQKPARLTVKQTYDKIEADLLQARSLMEDMDRAIQSQTSTATAARALVDQMVVDAMLARMYNYAGENNKAIEFASSVIDARPLATASEFPDIWKDGTTKEVVWSVKFQAFNSDIGGNVYYVINNRASFRPTQNLLALYDAGSDVRYTSYYQGIARRGNQRLVVSKYYGREGRTDGIVDFKAFRTGEMYLIRAEANARNGAAADALDDLNTLRTVRSDAPGNETGSSLMEAILNERRKELVGEGHRFFDLKRTTRTIDRTTNCTDFCTLPPQAREWNLPIPQVELDANANMVQNPGY